MKGEGEGGGGRVEEDGVRLEGRGERSMCEGRAVRTQHHVTVPGTVYYSHDTLANEGKLRLSR